MSNGNGKEKSGSTPLPPMAYYDFYKTNGLPREAHAFSNSDPSMTRQEFADECDINKLMKQYEGHDIGAIMRQVGEPVYYDFSEMPQDLMSFMQMQQDAEKAFMTLPASVRKEFDNDPLGFVEFASDPANVDQMRTWGLAKPAEKPQEAPVAQAPAAGASAPAAPVAPGGAATHGST